MTLIGSLLLSETSQPSPPPNACLSTSSSSKFPKNSTLRSMCSMDFSSLNLKKTFHDPPKCNMVRFFTFQVPVSVLVCFSVAVTSTMTKSNQRRNGFFGSQATSITVKSHARSARQELKQKPWRNADLFPLRILSLPSYNPPGPPARGWYHPQGAGSSSPIVIQVNIPTSTLTGQAESVSSAIGVHSSQRVRLTTKTSHHNSGLIKAHGTHAEMF